MISFPNLLKNVRSNCILSEIFTKLCNVCHFFQFDEKRKSQACVSEIQKSNENWLTIDKHRNFTRSSSSAYSTDSDYSSDVGITTSTPQFVPPPLPRRSRKKLKIHDRAPEISTDLGYVSSKWSTMDESGYKAGEEEENRRREQEKYTYE